MARNLLLTSVKKQAENIDMLSAVDMATNSDITSVVVV